MSKSDLVLRVCLEKRFQSKGLSVYVKCVTVRCDVSQVICFVKSWFVGYHPNVFLLLQ